MTAFEQVVSSFVPALVNEPWSVSFTNAGGKSSASVSGAGSSVRSSMWQYWPNCFTQAAVAAELEPGDGSGAADVGVTVEGFGFSTKT